MPTMPNGSRGAARPAARPPWARPAMRLPGSARWHGCGKASRATIHDAGCSKRWPPDGHGCPRQKTRGARRTTGHGRCVRYRAPTNPRRRGWRGKRHLGKVQTPRHPPRPCSRNTRKTRPRHPLGTPRAAQAPATRPPPQRMQTRTPRRRDRRRRRQARPPATHHRIAPGASSRPTLAPRLATPWRPASARRQHRTSSPAPRPGATARPPRRHRAMAAPMPARQPIACPASSAATP